MSFNQWKILNNLKDTLSKITNDISLQNNYTKDILQVIQKLQPSLYSKNEGKYMETANSGSISSIDKKDESYLPTVINGLKNKIGIIKEQPKKEVPKWKKTAGISECSIASTTEQILQSIEFANSDTLKLHWVEEFLKHIKMYPDIKNKAIKHGAIGLLLRTTSRTNNLALSGAIKESLAILGYADPVPHKGIRILAIDGGGVRGLLVLEMLKKLEELTGKKVYELFDFLCGVSTGSILALSIGIHHRDLEDISTIYEAISREVFKQSSWRGTGSLVWSHSYYDTALWEKKLEEHLTNESLISTARNPTCPKLCAISAVVNQTRLSAYVFRNYSLPWKFQSQYMGTCDCPIWHAARASAAAPTYFEEFKLGNLLHQDGGILVNNPTAIALHEAKLIWPNTPIQCVVSFGTGRIVSSPIELAKTSERNIDNISSTTSWTNKFFTILDSATDTEAVHIMLSDLLPDNVYYRFNPYLTEMISMVEIDPKKLEQLKRDAMMYLRRNEDKFQEAARALTEKKTTSQKFIDYIKVKREMFGLC